MCASIEFLLEIIGREEVGKFIPNEIIQFHSVA